MLGLSDVTRTSRVRSLTDRELPLAVEGYLVYCTCSILKFLDYRPLYKSPEVNWLKIGDDVRGTKIENKFFSCRPGTNATEDIK